MIASGEKPEEYRELKPYWIKRLLIIDYPIEELLEKKTIPHNIEYDIIENCFPTKTVLNSYWASFKEFDTVTFSHAYSKNRDQFEIELKSIEIIGGFAKWGAPLNKKCFVLKLGNIINKNF